MSFTMIPSSVGELLRDGKIKPAQLPTYYGLATFADNVTGECWPSRAQIARAAGYTKPDAVDPHLKVLQTAGAIDIRPRGYVSRDGGSLSAVRDDEHPVRATSLYRLEGLGVGSGGTPRAGGTRTPQPGGTRTPQPGGTGTPRAGVVTRPTQLDPIELDGASADRGRDNGGHDGGSSQGAEPPGFTDWWNTYPKKTGRGEARQLYAQALKQATPEELIDGARRYRDDPQRSPDYTKNPATWLRGEHWTDQPATRANDIRRWQID